MLVLHRLENEVIHIGPDIRLTVLTLGRLEMGFMLHVPRGVAVARPDSGTLEGPILSGADLNIYILLFREEDSVIVGQGITIKLVDMRHTGAGIGINAPRHIQILRPDMTNDSPKQSTSNPQSAEGLGNAPAAP